jgi:hypothetical protein
MLSQLAARAGDHVLEVGAGTGYIAAMLVEIVGEHGEVTTIDLDSETVDQARVLRAWSICQWALATTTGPPWLANCVSSLRFAICDWMVGPTTTGTPSKPLTERFRQYAGSRRWQGCRSLCQPSRVTRMPRS